MESRIHGVFSVRHKMFSVSGNTFWSDSLFSFIEGLVWNSFFFRLFSNLAHRFYYPVSVLKFHLITGKGFCLRFDENAHDPYSLAKI